MWVRFWFQETHKSPEYSYEWFDADPGDDVLRVAARQRAPEEAQEKGFERLVSLPLGVVDGLFSCWTPNEQARGVVTKTSGR